MYLFAYGRTSRTTNIHRNKSGDDCDELVADWLNPVHISSMKFDSKLAYACRPLQETADCVIYSDFSQSINIILLLSTA